MASTMTRYESNPISVDFARNGEIQLVFITLRYDNFLKLHPHHYRYAKL